MVTIEEIKDFKPKSTLIDQIPSYEQQRIIQESGILSNKPPVKMDSLVQGFVISMLMGFIMSCVQLFFEQLVHQQFVQDPDQGDTLRKWPITALLWGMFVFLSNNKFSDGYLIISHICSAYYALLTFSRQYPTYGETLKIAAVVTLCAYSSYQISIKALIVALIIEFILYFSLIYNKQL
eukprot:NODE_588_length_6359_cov_0.522843.p5 type:complete len:179 gc:universal NODE_588_length_6359_cov_0.522843:6213-5677(-)